VRSLLAVEEAFEAGPTALLVIVLLGLGIVLLARSMLKHLRRVPASFDPPATDESIDEPGADPPPRGTN
jgi:hypothetical protein